ncbi:hypothetical protein OSTOST_05156, partial [Ostertagia ostertagi]
QVETNKSAKFSTQKHQRGRKILTRTPVSSHRKRNSSSDQDLADAPDPTPSTFHSSSVSDSREETVATTSTSSLRRSAREPRPKRALSPNPNESKTPTSHEEIESFARVTMLRKTKLLGTRKNRDRRDEDNSDHTNGYRPVQPMEVSVEGGDEQVVADDDMENDLVDIQPFETGETVNEVFMTASFSRRDAVQHVNVSVLTLPQLSENIEHSAEDPFRQRSTDGPVPMLDNEIIVSSSPSGLEMNNEELKLNPQEKGVVVESGSGQSFVHDDEIGSSLEVFNDERCESYGTASGRDFTSEDINNHMEPPVLDGPIIDPSTYDLKPGVDAPPKLMADGVLTKETPKPMHYVVGEIYRVHTPNGTEQEVQLAVMDDGSEALVNANGEVVDLTPEDSYATIDICDIDFNFLDDKNIVCGLCGEVVVYSTLFTIHLSRVHPEIVHVVRHFNAWHPTNHQCAGQWQKRSQRPGVGKPLSKQDFAVIDLSHTQPDNLQCIWCGMFIDATTIAVHFTECHAGEVEVPKCLLCIQELVINARVIEKFGSDFDIVLPDEFHIKVEKLNKLFTSESQMDSAIEKYLDTLNGKRKRAPLTVERRVFEGDSVVVHPPPYPETMTPSMD